MTISTVLIKISTQQNLDQKVCIKKSQPRQKNFSLDTKDNLDKFQKLVLTVETPKLVYIGTFLYLQLDNVLSKFGGLDFIKIYQDLSRFIKIYQDLSRFIIYQDLSRCTKIQFL